MSYCMKCGKEIGNGAAFCVGCGAPVEKEISVASVQKEVSAVVVQPQTFNEGITSEEREFLNNTHKLLRWELKAWNIASKVLIIMGIVYAAIFSLYILIGMAMAAENHYIGELFIVIGIIAVLFGGGMFIGIGIVNKKAAEKLPQYIDTVYTDFSISYKRCGNVGMMVFSIIFGTVSPIFFIINFARMKANRDLIERIMRNQNIQG